MSFTYTFTGPYDRVFPHLHFDTLGVSVKRHDPKGPECVGAVLLQPGDVLKVPAVELHSELAPADAATRKATEAAVAARDAETEPVLIGEHGPEFDLSPASTEPQE